MGKQYRYPLKRSQTHLSKYYFQLGHHFGNTTSKQVVMFNVKLPNLYLKLIKTEKQEPNLHLVKERTT